MKKKSNKVFPVIPFNATNATWNLFEGTGNPGYYMLYKRLIEEDEELEDEEKFE